MSISHEPFCKFRLTSSDVLLDGGCSGGTALLILVAISNCTGIGVEISCTRWAWAIKHSQSIMNSPSEKDLKVCFKQADILDYQNFNGITVLYMYDNAFDKSKYHLLAEALNRSTTLRCFISSVKLVDFQEFGLADVWSQDDSFDLKSVGGKCSRKLFIYNQNVNLNIEASIHPDMQNLLDIANSKEIRSAYVDESYHAWISSEEYIRNTKIPVDTHYMNQSVKLFNLLDKKSYFTNDSLARYYAEGSIIEADIGNRSKYR